jgi:hypothetical protein
VKEGIRMGLISKEVIIEITSRTMTHYKNLGYEIPQCTDKNGKIFIRKGTKILVKVEDVTKGSQVQIEAKCDCEDCKNPVIRLVSLANYNRNPREEGKYYCRICANKLFGGESIRKKALSKGKSFYEWCIENNRQEILSRWDYDLNKLNPNDLSYGSSKECYFKCPQGIHKSEPRSLISISRKCAKDPT